MTANKARCGGRYAHPCIFLAAALASSSANAGDFTYHVARGDTVIGISNDRLAVPSLWQRLARHNHLADPDRIFPGQPLRIPLAWMKRTPTGAQVTEVSGGVVATLGAGAAVALQPGARLDTGTAITTRDDGFVTLRLADGSSVRIKSGTAMRLDTLTRIADTEAHQSLLSLILGRLEVLAAKLRGPATRFSIDTPVGSTAVRGTEFRVGTDAGGTRQFTEVIEGTVRVAAVKGAADKTVEAGFGTAVDASGRIASPVALLAAPDLTRLPALVERPLVRLRLEPIAGAAAYRGQVGNAAAFATALAEVVSVAPELRFQGLPDGNYVVRVRGVDAQGLEGRDGEHAFRLKARPEPPIPSTPGPAGKLRGVSVAFSWSQNTEADHYVFQLSRDPDFSAVQIERLNVNGNSHDEPGPLGPGLYAWRVASVRANGDRGPFGDPQRFELLPPPPQPEPPQIGDSEVSFSWGGEPGQRFEFELARDEAFAQDATHRALDAPHVSLPRPEAGSWYVRYRAIDPDGYVGPYTAPQRFSVPACARDSGGRCVGVGSGGVLGRD